MITLSKERMKQIIMTRVEYNIDTAGLEFTSLVYETKRQKDILYILDEMLENAEHYGWAYTFEDTSFYIEYADGTTYEANEWGAYGVYKKEILSVLFM